jgi:hypothetical protein
VRRALLAVVLLGVVGAASWGAGCSGPASDGAASDEPLAVTQVPSRLPDRGVQLEDGDIVLTPWAIAPHRAMSADRAITAARFVSGHRALPVTALKAELTTAIDVPDAPLPGPTYIIRERDGPDGMEHVPVWLVTYTSPKPIDVGVRGAADYVTQFSEAVNPVTGKYVWGFETPLPFFQSESKYLLGDANPKVLRTETVRDLGGNPETVSTVHGNLKHKASYGWLVLGDYGEDSGVTTASQLAAIASARRASPRFSIFPDFPFGNILCLIPIGDSALTMPAVCHTRFIAPRTIRFQARWPVRVPAHTWRQLKRFGWIVSLDRNDHVRSIRQFGDPS